MSLTRLVYYSALISGYAAFLGWLVAELLFFRSGAEVGTMKVLMVAGIVGAVIGLGLGLVGGMANAQWWQLLRRALPGLLGGCLGGAVGALIGDLLYKFGLPRAIGWLIMGLGIGAVDGLYERSQSKIRNGLIGGSIGGLLGGFLFDPIQNLITSQSGMSSRATAFVILGICIGAMIGLAQVVLREAWLTVLDGYRAGRQLILGQAVTYLGRGDHLPLPFLGPMNRDLESEHVKITRQPSGAFVVQDNHSKAGTRLNNQPLQGAVQLKDGDVIKFGTNFVRFNERRHHAGDAAFAPVPFVGQIQAAPPPRKPGKPAVPGAPPPLPGAGASAPAAAPVATVNAERVTPRPPAPQRPTAVAKPTTVQPQSPTVAKPAPTAQPGAGPAKIAAPPPPRRPKSAGPGNS